MTYPIIEIPDNAPESPEQQGTKTKYWIHLNGNQLLFKIGRENTGENWAEIVACQLCELLDLPHAHYDFAVWKHHKGVITKNIVPTDAHLVMGNELLSEVYESYPFKAKYKVQDHTLGRIYRLLSHPDIQLPLGWTARVPSLTLNSAIDVFLGYLLLDAWIANQDRHHENWGIISCNEHIYLAPTYDHAASLGQNERDDKREDLLRKRKGRHISDYIIKARSAIYLNKSASKPMLTIEAFQLLGQIRPDTARYWLQRLRTITPEQCRTIFNNIPKTEISDITIEFSMKLLELNKMRLLEVTP
jgi:hypothetical protein